MPLDHEALTRSVIGAFYKVYNTLGFGFLESIYTAALELELRDRGHQVGREVLVRVYYGKHQVGSQRLDMVVDEVLVVEAKSTTILGKNAPRQVLNYLRATNLEVGLLLYFGPEAAVFRFAATNSRKRFGCSKVVSPEERIEGSDASDQSA